MSSRSPYRSPSPGSDDDPTNDPDMGSQLLEREIRRLEQEIATLKAKLHRAQDTIMELEKEKEDRYTKIKAEVYESSMQLLHGFQRGHNDAQDTSMRRIEFLEKELDQAKSDLASSDRVRRELLEKQAECRELTEALEELEAQQSAEIQRAVESARREWQSHGEQEQGSDMLASQSLNKFGLRPGVGVNGFGGEVNPVGDSDSDRERETGSGAVAGVSNQVDGEGAQAGAVAGLMEASRGQEVEDLQMQLDAVCEERDQLQHRCCDADEKNKRLERELHRMMDMQRQMDVKFNQYQMEHQIVLEMEARNRRWASPLKGGPVADPIASPLQMLPTSDAHPGGTRACLSRSASESSAATPRGAPSSRDGGGVGDASVGVGGESREAEEVQRGGRSSEQLFLQNSVEYLKAQLEERDAEIRALKTQYACSPATPSTDKIREQRQQLADEVLSAKGELARIQMQNKSIISPESSAPLASADMAVFRKLKAQEARVEELTRENSMLKKQQGMTERQSGKAGGEGGGGGGGGGGVSGSEEYWYRILQRLCVLVPDDKRTVQEAVLKALEEGKAVFVRRGVYRWRHTSIQVSGQLRLVCEEGAVLQGSWQMGEDSGGLLDGAICEALHLPCVLRVQGGRWAFRNCIFRGQLMASGGENPEETAGGDEGDLYREAGREEDGGPHLVVLSGDADVSFAACHFQLSPLGGLREGGEEEERQNWRASGSGQCGMVACDNAEVQLTECQTRGLWAGMDVMGSTRQRQVGDESGTAGGCALYFRDESKGELRRWRSEGFRHGLGIGKRAAIKLVEGCVVQGTYAFLLGQAALPAGARLQVNKGNRLICLRLTASDSSYDDLRLLLNRSASRNSAENGSWLFDHPEEDLASARSPSTFLSGGTSAAARERLGAARVTAGAGVGASSVRALGEVSDPALLSPITMQVGGGGQGGRGRGAGGAKGGLQVQVWDEGLEHGAECEQEADYEEAVWSVAPLSPHLAR